MLVGDAGGRWWNRPWRGRHRRPRGRGARYAVGGLVLVAGAFEVAYLIAGASVSGGGGDAGGLGAAEAPSRPPGGGSGAAGRPSEVGSAGPGVRPSATSLLLTGTSPLPTADTPSSPPLAPAATPTPQIPGTTPRPPAGSDGGESRPTGAPTGTAGATPGTGGTASPPDSPPRQDGSGSGSGLCVPVVGVCVDPLGHGDGAEGGEGQE